MLRAEHWMNTVSVSDCCAPVSGQPPAVPGLLPAGGQPLSGLEQGQGALGVSGVGAWCLRTGPWGMKTRQRKKKKKTTLISWCLHVTTSSFPRMSGHMFKVSTRQRSDRKTVLFLCTFFLLLLFLHLFSARGKGLLLKLKSEVYKWKRDTQSNFACMQYWVQSKV